MQVNLLTPFKSLAFHLSEFFVLDSKGISVISDLYVLSSNESRLVKKCIDWTKSILTNSRYLNRPKV